MSSAALSGVSSIQASSRYEKVDPALAAAAKALRLQREQAAAVVGLIEQAAPAGDIGRIISVRA